MATKQPSARRYPPEVKERAIQFLDDDETIFITFGPDGDALAPGDEAAVRAALEAAIPGMRSSR